MSDAFNTEGDWTAGFYAEVFLLAALSRGVVVNIINEYDKAGRVTKRCYQMNVL
jgi:hypothetical protein